MFQMRYINDNRLRIFLLDGKISNRPLFIGFTAFPIVGPTTSIVYFGVDEFIGWERAGEILKRLNDYNIEVTGEPIVPPYKI